MEISESMRESITHKIRKVAANVPPGMSEYSMMAMGVERELMKIVMVMIRSGIPHDVASNFVSDQFQMVMASKEQAANNRGAGFVRF